MTSNYSPPYDLPRLPPRKRDSHKGDFGRALIIGGSQGMAGAVALAGMAALRSGAGLVKLATPTVCQPTVASFEPSAMTIGLQADGDGRIAGWARNRIAESLSESTAAACGPGLGRSEELVELVAWLYRDAERPLVVDADALFALAQRASSLGEHVALRILTPHAGEFARLLGREKFDARERETLAREFAARNRVVLVLKGHDTVVTDGDRMTINPTGNPGMATGGTGDVLTGVITAMLCQGLTAFDAARLGAYVHGLAGDLAAAAMGEVSLVASDLIAFLPRAWKQLAS
jgi:ADP-dependent NAD(P)H-hydrate dehydratase